MYRVVNATFNKATTQWSNVNSSQPAYALATQPNGLAQFLTSPASSTPFTSWTIQPDGLGTYNVKSFGAKGDGSTNDAAAIQSAVNAAGAAGGGVVYFPPGTYIVASAITTSGSATRFVGAGREATTLRQTTTSADVLYISHDYCEVRNITLDAQTDNAKAAIHVQANNVIVDSSQMLGGTANACLNFAGPAGATQSSPLYNTGNVIQNCIINAAFNGDDFYWAFQSQSKILNILHTGTRLSLYVCQDTVVDTYYWTFYSSTNANNGWYVTAPATNIALKGFLLLATAFPKISNQIVGGTTYWTINFLWDGGYAAAGTSLFIGNGVSVRLRDLYFAQTGSTGSGVNFSPNNSPGAALYDLTIESCNIPQFAFNGTSGNNGIVQARFVDNYFPPYLPTGTRQSLVNFNAIGNSIWIDGGNFQNGSNGLTYDPSAAFVLNISKLVGYNPRGSISGVSVPASGSAQTNNTGVDVTAVITPASGQTISAISIGGNSTGLSVSSPNKIQVQIPAQQTITMTYSPTSPKPSWLWFGD